MKEWKIEKKSLLAITHHQFTHSWIFSHIEHIHNLLLSCGQIALSKSSQVLGEKLKAPLE